MVYLAIYRYNTLSTPSTTAAVTDILVMIIDRVSSQTYVTPDTGGDVTIMM